MKIISKEQTIKELRNYADLKCCNGEVELANGILKAKCFIENRIPTVDAEPVVYGEWVEMDDDIDVWYQCSVCRHDSTSANNFCSHCGADMRKKVE